MAALYASFIAGFFILYFAHLRAGSPYVAAQPSAPDVRGRLALSAAAGLGQRFFAPAAYMMVAYGGPLGRRALFMFAQLPGWWIVLRKDREALWPVMAFVVFWIAFTAIIGAASSYWGQMYVPVAIVGSAALLAWAAPLIDST